jgi:hypothetical protein
MLTYDEVQYDHPGLFPLRGACLKLRHGDQFPKFKHDFQEEVLIVHLTQYSRSDKLLSKVFLY